MNHYYNYHFGTVSTVWGAEGLLEAMLAGLRFLLANMQGSLQLSPASVDYEEGNYWALKAAKKVGGRRRIGYIGWCGWGLEVGRKHDGKDSRLAGSIGEAQREVVAVDHKNRIAVRLGVLAHPLVG